MNKNRNQQPPTTRRAQTQKKEFRKILKYILEAMEEAETWSIDTKNDIRELSTSELIELGLMDGYCHYEDTGRRTIVIKYKMKGKKADKKEGENEPN